MTEGNMKNSRFAFLLLSGLVLTGCAGRNAIDEAVPPAAFGETDAPATSLASLEQPRAPIPGVDPDPAFAGSGQAVTTNTYPNINREPQAAVPQLTDAERDALLAEMQQLAVAHSKGIVSQADYRRRLAELRNLAATHSQATIKIIEK